MVDFITIKKEGIVKMIIHILQRRKPLLKNSKLLAQGHTNIKCPTAVLFTIAEICKQPKCPSMDEYKCGGGVCVYMYLCVYTHTHTHTQMDYYSTMRKQEILPLTTM